MYIKDSKITYYTSEKFGISGRRKGTDIKERISGFEFLLDESDGKSILDLGCAEGLISLEFAKSGASSIDGFEVQDISVETAIRVFNESEIKIPYKFEQANLNDFDNFVKTGKLKEKYDIVLFLGVYHHLKGGSANKVLVDCFNRSNEYVVIRTDSIIPNIKEMENFELIKDDMCKNITGRVRIYKNKK